MPDVRSYLALTPWEALMQIIADDNNVFLNPAFTSLKSRVLTAPNTLTVELAPNQSKSEANLDSILPEVLTYSYPLLSLNEFFRVIDAVVIDRATLPINSHTIAKYLGDLNGIVFDADDIEDAEFDVHDNTNTVTIHAGPNSLRWVGELTVRLTYTTKHDLGQLAVAQLPEALTFPSDPNKIQGIIYSAGYDFTRYRYVLQAIARGRSLYPKVLAGILAQVTGDPWEASTTPIDFNVCMEGTELLDGLPLYRLLYAGAPQAAYTPFLEYKSILVLGLSETLSTAIGGVLVMHYN